VHLLNKFKPKEPTPAGIIIFCNLVQLSNVKLPIETKVDGNFILNNKTQLPKT
jgi:hypothetical protein